MPYNSARRSATAASEARIGGKFASKTAKPTPPPSPAPSIETTIKTPLTPDSPHKKYDTSLDAPLVSVEINNPFKKILHWLDYIRRKQTTEFDVKLKIPLLAWGVLLGVLFGALGLSFNLAQYIQSSQLSSLLSKSSSKPLTLIIPTPIPTPILLSRIGIIKAAYQLGGMISAAPSVPSARPSEPGRSGVASIPSGSSPSHYVLVTSIDQVTFLTVAPAISLTEYLNKRVLVTGVYDGSKNTLAIRRDEDVEFLP